MFGEIIVPNNQSASDIKAQMILNDAGKIAHECWLEIPNHFPNVVLHEFVIMPNHIHGIIEFVVVANNNSPNIVGANYYSHNKEISKDVSSKIERLNNHLSNMETNEITTFNEIWGQKTDSNRIGSLDDVGAKIISQNMDSNKNMSLDDVGAKIISQNMDSNKNMSLDDVGAKIISPLRSPSKTIGSVVRGFKIGVTKWMRQNTNIYDVWQRNYHEHIIRNDQSYQKISNYIKNNPTKWADDKFYKKR